MKKYVCRLGLLAAALVCVNSGVVFADDMTSSTPDKPAAPGSAEQKDSKNQENNPTGTTDQMTHHPSERSKHHKKMKTHAPQPMGDQSGDKATKTPQMTTPPSTPNP